MIGPSEKSARILAELQAFMAEHIYPNEVAHQEALAGADNRFASMPLVDGRLGEPVAMGLEAFTVRILSIRCSAKLDTLFL